jgi:predicted carbohydrate-binding protein with CBM5 and CBM33 domain
MIRTVIRGLLVLSLLAVLFGLLSHPVLGHGATQTPMSRVYSCFLENPETPDTAACHDAVVAGGTQPLYDWNEVHILNAAGNHQALIPDGKLCSAGNPKYAAFDQPRTDWVTTILPSSGQYTFVFNAFVPHNLGFFQFYVTKDGYDPLQPLKWSDLESTPFLRVDNPPLTNGTYVMTGQLPTGKSGRHLIYTIWQRTDSAEAFYSCSDVWFGSSPTPTPTAAPGCTSPEWTASVVYQMGDMVSHNGRQWRAKWSTSGQEPSTDGSSNGWEPLGFCQPGGGGPTNTPTRVVTNTPTRVVTNTPTSVVTNTPTRVVTNTPTRVVTNTPTRAVTNTPTRTVTNTPIGPSPTPTRTPTPGSGTTCSPVTATITAPFTFDGAGTLCWRSSNLGSNINSWNTASVTVNGVNFTNLFAFTSNLPPKAADGFWYVSYTGNFPWSHFEAK